MLYRHGSCPKTAKKGGVPLWTIAAAIGVVVLIAVVAVVLRSLDQHASDVTKPFNFTCFFWRRQYLCVLTGERDLKENLRLLRLSEHCTKTISYSAM